MKTRSSKQPKISETKVETKVEKKSRPKKVTAPKKSKNKEISLVQPLKA